MNYTDWYIIIISLVACVGPCLAFVFGVEIGKARCEQDHLHLPTITAVRKSVRR